MSAMYYIPILKQLTVMAIIALSGFAATVYFKFGKTEQQFMSKMLLYFVNPCMIITSFNVPFNSLMLKQLGVVLLIALAAHLALTLLAELFCRSKTTEGKSLDGIDKIAVVFTNCAFIGIPLIKGVFGSGGVFFLMGYVVIFNLYLWTYGFYSVGGKISFSKIILNPNIIAVILGLTVFCIPYQLHETIALPLKFIADMTTAMSMILLGMLFGTFKFNDASSKKGIIKYYLIKTMKISFIRLIASAFLLFFVVFAAYKIFKNIEDIRLICYVVFVSALCPVGMSVSGFAVVFNKDESYSGLLVSVTSLLCILTLPLSVAAAELFF